MTIARSRESTSATTAKLIALWAALHDAIVGAVENELGEQRLRDILYLPLRRAGREAAARTRPDATAIAEDIIRLEEAFDLDGRVLETGPEHVVREVTKCPWSSVRPASCKVFAWWMEGYCQGLNPAYCYRLEQLIPEGAETCIWSVSRCSDSRPFPILSQPSRSRPKPSG